MDKYVLKESKKHFFMHLPYHFEPNCLLQWSQISVKPKYFSFILPKKKCNYVYYVLKETFLIGENDCALCVKDQKLHRYLYKIQIDKKMELHFRIWKMYMTLKKSIW